MKMSCGSGRSRGSPGGLTGIFTRAGPRTITGNITIHRACTALRPCRGSVGRRSVDLPASDRPLAIARPPCPLEELLMSSIQSVMHENRVFEPSPEWVAQATIKKADYDAMCAAAGRDFEGFWANLARETLAW